MYPDDEQQDEDEDHGQGVLRKRPAEAMAKSSGEEVFWHFDGVGHKQVGTELATSTTWEGMDGFKLFVFDDGSKWLSEEPVLEETETKNKNKAMKRPAMFRKPAEAPITKSSPWKLFFSKTYHQAKAEYNKQCKSRGIEVNGEDMKAFIKAKTDQAREDFDRL